VKAV